jgi:hypothetical protein
VIFKDLLGNIMEHAAVVALTGAGVVAKYAACVRQRSAFPIAGSSCLLPCCGLGTPVAGGITKATANRALRTGVPAVPSLAVQLEFMRLFVFRRWAPRARWTMSNSQDSFDAMAIVIGWIDACPQGPLEDLIGLYADRATVDCCREADSRAKSRCGDTGSRIAELNIRIPSRSTI